MYDHGDLDRIVISPGPGHPRTDSGISRDVLTWGIGKIPILGVCMGLECLVDVLGGEVSVNHYRYYNKRNELIIDLIRWRNQTWKSLSSPTRCHRIIPRSTPTPLVYSISFPSRQPLIPTQGTSSLRYDC
jgi:anthranilate synthase/indole-3-glycerol phosphate synthase/phosphoribosylanthranilate isomerase